MPNVELDFEYYKRAYTNGSPETEEADLRRCLNSATDFSQMFWVYNAAWSKRQDGMHNAIRPETLKRLIALATNAEDACQALIQASKLKRHGQLLYPTRYREAVKKMQSFTNPAQS
jgi:hypothetical protein